MKKKTLIQRGWLLFCLNAILIMLLSFRFSKYIYIENSTTLIYTFITVVSHFTAISLIPFLVFYPIAKFIKGTKHILTTAVILSTSMLLLLILDSFVFDLYRFHINGFVLGLVFGGAAGDIFEFSFVIYLIFIAAVAFLIFIQIMLSKFALYLTKFNIRKFNKYFLISTFILMFTSHAIHAWADAARFTAITKASKYYPLYFPLTAKSLFYKYFIDKSKIEKNNIETLGKNSDYVYPKNTINTTNKNLNVLYIALDCWQTKFMNSFVTPNIYKFSKECNVFQNHMSGSNGTRGGVFSIFYGLPSLYWDDFKTNLQRPVIMDTFLKHNYQIKTFASAALTSPSFDMTVFAGIKDLKLKMEGKNSNERDKKLTKNWIQFTDNFVKQDNPKPFFGFLFYDAMHAKLQPKDYPAPFQPAWKYGKYFLLNNDLDPTEYKNLQKNLAYYIDGLVKEVIDDLKKKDLLKNTIVVITGDHGQEFNENKKNYWGHNGNFTKEQIGVPLLLYIPNKTPEIYSHWTSHYDIAPTIMQTAFDCKNPNEDYSIGKNMFNTTEREWMISGSKINFAIVEKDRITTMDYDGTYEITDLKLNKIKDAKIRAKKIGKAIKTVNSFYK